MIKKNKVQNYLLLIFFLIFISEIVSFFFIKFFLVNYGIVYNHNNVDKNYENYLKSRHQILGWDNSTGQVTEKLIDNYGARRDYSANARLKPCIDVYGDSFTYGYYKAKKAWPSLLSGLVNCRVRNFGVGGFGSDQAYIKFQINKNHSNIVFLNHLSENIIRNVNQYRNFIYPSERYKFKPRYILEDNKLKLISLPKIPKEKISDYLINPQNYLKHEYFIPNGPSGIQYWNFPYTVRILNSFKHWHIKQKIKNNDTKYSEFYNENHSSNGLNLTFEIMSDFYKSSKSKGLIPIVTVFPTCKDLKFFEKNNKFPYENLINMFKRENYKFIDFGGKFVNKSNGNFNKYFQECSGHYNEKGEALVAQIIFEYLKDNKLLVY